MKYTSPFHILPEGFSVGDLASKSVLKQARKRLLAEFELLGTSTIFINEQAFDKDTVLKFFDKLETDANLDLHAQIFQFKPLLSFLEKENVTEYAQVCNFLEEQKSKENTRLLDFISPYFAEVFDKVFFEAVRKRFYLERFLDVAFPLDNAYESRAYQSTYRWFYSKINEVKDIENDLKSNVFVQSSRVYEMINPSVLDTFNKMPQYFFNSRDLFAFRLYEVVVLLNNKYERTELAREVIDAGLKLEVTERTKRYFTEADKIVEKKKKGKWREWVIPFFILQFILAIIRWDGCESSRPLNYQDFPSYTIPDSFYLKLKTNDLLDSSYITEELLEKMEDIPPLKPLDTSKLNLKKPTKPSNNGLDTFFLTE
jgi:hypothetical protein